MRGLFVMLSALVLAACQSPRERLDRLAADYRWSVEVLSVADFPLLIAASPSLSSSSVLRVYLEGDGRAWVTPSQPSRDPTPRALLVATLAMRDPMPSIYMSRPCQFVRAVGCTPALWTSRRFSLQVVDGLSQALDQLKRRHGNRAFELVGYSGGGALALLLAARRDDVVRVQTLAGNLSPAQWARQLELIPLEGSLEPLLYRERLAQVAQRHLVGEADRQMPAAVAAYYGRQLGESRCLEFVMLPGVTHAQGWEQAWRHWRDRPLGCAAPVQAP
ncbi:alpha/beta hydrolase [Pseudomonas entomophila]|nr:alpha/beta hydrolase [Pseudomonas entomophila]MDF0730999.1 alpha/beta hydrolase [Pseudomonas entomophila]